MYCNEIPEKCTHYSYTAVLPIQGAVVQTYIIGIDHQNKQTEVLYR